MIIIGSVGNDKISSNRGSVYAHACNTNSHAFQAKLASDYSMAYDWFGASV